MTNKELAEEYAKRLHNLIAEIKEREEKSKTSYEVVATTKYSKEKENIEKEFDFVEDYLSGTTNPLLRWYRDYRKKK